MNVGIWVLRGKWLPTLVKCMISMYQVHNQNCNNCRNKSKILSISAQTKFTFYNVNHERGKIQKMNIWFWCTQWFCCLSCAICNFEQQHTLKWSDLFFLTNFEMGASFTWAGHIIKPCRTFFWFICFPLFARSFWNIFLCYIHCKFDSSRHRFRIKFFSSFQLIRYLHK